MAYIYKIINKINGKEYIGNTTRNVGKRFKEHIRDSRNKQRNDRLLLKDIKKYSEDCFELEIIEKVNDDISFDREQYWIKKYKTFEKGYNMTLGGNGKTTIEHNKVIDLYKKIKNQNKVAEILNISPDSVSNILKANDINILKSKEVIKKEKSKKVLKKDLKTNKILKQYESINEAARDMGNVKKRLHISEVCRNKRKTAYGYKWEFFKNK